MVRFFNEARKYGRTLGASKRKLILYSLYMRKYFPKQNLISSNLQKNENERINNVGIAKFDGKLRGYRNK